MVLTQGEMEVKLDETYFEKGEPLKGRVILHLPAPINARSLRIEFYLECREQGRTDFDKALLNKKQISGNRTYNDKEELPFVLDIPRSLDYDAKPERGHANGWYVHAVLDVPLASDLNARAQALPYRKEPQEMR